MRFFKNENKFAFASVLVVSTFLGAVGQLAFKIGVSSPLWTSLALYVGLGFVVYALSTVLYFYILSRTHLSWAYSFGGLSYIFTTILAATILGEAVPLLRWAGVLIIALGVALISMS
ncbi:MAG: EamA family transporter [Candidatus Micrarchaeota archaeon]|nr:EamA family transporter [Candidatus Micrarchaeota archaeon]